MSDDAVFRSHEQDLAKLTHEMDEIRILLTAIKKQTDAMERQVLRAFAATGARRAASGTKAVARPRATVTHEESIHLFEELVALAKGQGNSAVEERLAKLAVPSLKLLARASGVPGASKLKREELHRAIRGQVSESVVLSLR